ncbi:hypothetical protein WKW79_29045 [Variovorax robiniae]|uniref:Uncharacterized protein n=1 Tax=Variovorax robiniae TaxID=1836199 RepID=A0ABU8XJ05_9BURK
MEQEEFLIQPFQGLLEKLYFASVCFLDAHQLPGYRDLFLATFGVPFDAEGAAKKHREAAWVPYESDPPNNEFLSRLSRFLAPFDLEVEQKPIEEAEQRNQVGREMLERILRNTASALYRLGVVPASEPDVYKAVKKFIDPVFPSAIDASSGFYSTLKTYKPDILVPEIYTAIEYKFADSEEKLKSFFGEIAEDVKGYKGDDKYRWFYAVVYATTDFIGAERFQKSWEDHDFPPHWQAIYVVGASQSKKQKKGVAPAPHA